MVCLTAIVTPRLSLALLAHWKQDRGREVVFRPVSVATDGHVRRLYGAQFLPLVHVFWELGLVPMVFPHQDLGRRGPELPPRSSSLSTHWRVASRCCWRSRSSISQRIRSTLWNCGGWPRHRHTSWPPRLRRWWATLTGGPAFTSMRRASPRCCSGRVPRVRHQGADLAIPHVVAGRAHPGDRQGGSMLLAGHHC